MRTKIKPKNFDDGNWYEYVCAYEGCKNPTFYTDNKLATHCTDLHRSKANDLKNKPKSDQLRQRNKQFKVNYQCLKRLYSIGILYPTLRDFTIAGFVADVRNSEIKIAGNSAFEYFEYVLVIKKDGTFEIKKT